MGIVFSTVKNDKDLGLGTSYIIKYIENRVYVHDKNFMCAIIAQTGGGKSTSALALMEILNPNKTPEELVRNVCFTPKEFLERATDENNQKGEVIVPDEAGVSQNSKQWQSVYNRVANFVLQTFRYRNQVVLFCLPSLTFLDSDTRKLLHAVFEVKNINKSENTTTIKPLFIQVNNHTGKVYPKYLRIKNKGVIVPIKTIKLKKPSQELINLYLEKKKAFTKNLYGEILGRVEKIELKEKNESVPVELATLENPTRAYTEHQKDVLNALFKYDNVEEAALYCEMPLNSFKAHIPNIYRKIGLKNIHQLREVIKNRKEKGIFAV